MTDTPLPNSSSPVVVWRCDDCGWTILDDDAVDGQPCEAWLDGETEEHGTCLRRNLVKAGALIAAEIDRLQRAESREQKP